MDLVKNTELNYLGLSLRIFVLSTASDHSDSQPQLGNTELDAHSNPFQLWNFVIFLLFYKWPTKIEREKKRGICFCQQSIVLRGNARVKRMGVFRKDEVWSRKSWAVLGQQQPKP